MSYNHEKKSRMTAQELDYRTKKCTKTRITLVFLTQRSFSHLRTFLKWGLMLWCFWESAIAFQCHFRKCAVADTRLLKLYSVFTRVWIIYSFFLEQMTHVIAVCLWIKVQLWMTILRQCIISLPWCDLHGDADWMHQWVWRSFSLCAAAGQKSARLAVWSH